MKSFRAVIILAALVVVVCVVAAGAGKYSEKTLVGTWQFDMVAMFEQAMKQSGQELPEGMDVKTLVGDSYMWITFAKDGSFTFESMAMQREVNEEGTWELIEVKDNTVTVKSTNSKGEEKVMPITFVDEDNFEAVMTEGEMEVKLTAARVKKDAKKEKKAE
jgi:hypothetical protein